MSCGIGQSVESFVRGIVVHRCVRDSVIPTLCSLSGSCPIIWHHLVLMCVECCLCVTRLSLE